MGWRIFPGIAEQVGQGLGQRSLVPVHHQSRLQAHFQIDLGSEPDGLEGDQRLVDDVRHGDGSTGKGRAAGFDPGNGQKLRHQAIETRQLLMDHVQTALLFRRIVDSVFAQGVDEETNRGQGGAQLVRDRREKLVLHSRQTRAPSDQDRPKDVTSQGCATEGENQNSAHQRRRFRVAGGQEHDPDHRHEHRRDQGRQHEDHAGALQDDDGR